MLVNLIFQGFAVIKSILLMVPVFRSLFLTLTLDLYSSTGSFKQHFLLVLTILFNKIQALQIDCN